MKSLEYVNKLIEEKKHDLYNLQDMKEGTPKEIFKNHYAQEYKALNQIKRDLEIIEIFKKRVICRNNVGSHGFKNSHKHFIFILYNHLEEQKEDFNIVNQWLEENEDE